MVWISLALLTCKRITHYSARSGNYQIISNKSTAGKQTFLVQVTWMVGKRPGQKNCLCTVYIGSAANSANDFYCTHEVNVLTLNNPHCQFVLWSTVLDSPSKWMCQLSMWIISLMSISCANQNNLENLHISWQIQTLACGDLQRVIKTCLCDCKSINGSKAWPYIYPRDVCLSLHGWWYGCIHRKFQ